MTTTLTRPATTTTSPWTPCARHLRELATEVGPALRSRAHWRMSAEVWKRISDSPDYRGDAESTPTYACPTTHRLFGVLVHLNGLGNHVDLIIATSCEPEP